MSKHRATDCIRYLDLLVFVCGLATLGTEMAASRLLAPYFGTSLPVWSSLIGLILLALALGYLLGGSIADRHPRLPVLLHIVAAAGVCLVLLPVISRPILTAIVSALMRLRFGILAGSFLAVVALMGIPMVLLGCVTPFAVRLSTDEVSRAGRSAGRLFAWSTVGSFAGALLPALVMIPWVGTRLTFVMFGCLLLLVCVPGYVFSRRRGGVAACLVLLAGAGVCGRCTLGTPIKSGARLLFEGESVYQYVRVEEDARGWRRLKINEGLVTHSKFHPDVPLTYGEWDFFAVAPFFNAAPYDPFERAVRWALIGSGAGTTARLLTKIYGPVSIHGVEIDPLVVEVGRRYFDMDRANFVVTVQDGRAWMATATNVYDVIAVDAYRQPYIPFELTTVEFFQQVHGRLADAGVVCINVAEPEKDRRLVNALAASIERVFAGVFLLRLRDTSNATLVIGTKQAAGVEDFAKNSSCARGLAKPLVLAAAGNIEAFCEHGMVLTDDRAPVERLMDLMLVRAMRRRADGKGGI